MGREAAARNAEQLGTWRAEAGQLQHHSRGFQEVTGPPVKFRVSEATKRFSIRVSQAIFGTYLY